jgi:hypothetical protein
MYGWVCMMITKTQGKTDSKSALGCESRCEASSKDGFEAPYPYSHMINP